jgi:cyd operon protein YbgT
MWYFTWVLGAGFACAFAILNAMWLEVHESDGALRRNRR